MSGTCSDTKCSAAFAKIRSPASRGRHDSRSCSMNTACGARKRAECSMPFEESTPNTPALGNCLTRRSVLFPGPHPRSNTILGTVSGTAARRCLAARVRSVSNFTYSLTSQSNMIRLITPLDARSCAGAVRTRVFKGLLLGPRVGLRQTQSSSKQSR
jgi:hypothetical protein